ncbi:MAG: hypothetical protein R3264_10090, partial [Anaerolineae bacterium]|nr:hypothetical protein [Anaerolineae bacterium]
SSYETQFHVPVRYQTTEMGDLYSVEICGIRLQSSDPKELLARSKSVLKSFINFSRMPTYIFIAQNSRKIYPVYTVHDEVRAITHPGGPLMQHVELAKVRQDVTDFFNLIHANKTLDQMERLHVRGVHRKTLRLVRPIFYLKKRPRSADENEFWAPVFPSMTSQAIYTYAANERREVALDNGHEVFRLREKVAQALINDRRLRENYDLRVDRLLPDYWQKVSKVLKKQPQQLVHSGLALDVYQVDDYFVALETRKKEDRYSFYIGDDLADLIDRASQDLIRRGKMSRLASLELAD